MTDKDVTQEDKIFTKKEHDGVIKDLQSERDQRHEIQYKFEQSQRDIESLKKTVDEMKKSVPTEPISKRLNFEGESDDFAKIKDVKASFENFEKEAYEKLQKAQKEAKKTEKEEALKETYRSSCFKARERYLERKDIGLDFDTVYKAAIRLLGGNQYDELAILHSSNPGERLYKLGCEDPEMVQKLKLEANQELLKDMGTRKVDKTSLQTSTDTKDKEFYSLEKIAGMSTTEAQADLVKVEKSMEHYANLKKEKK